MILESLENASQWLSFRSFARGLLSFHLWWCHSSGVTSNTAASSSPWCQGGCLPVRWMASLFDPQWRWRCLWHSWRGCCGGGSPIAVASWGVVTKKPARDIFPVSNCKQYMSTLWALGDRLVRLLHKPPEKIGNPALLSLWPHAPSLAYFH